MKMNVDPEETKSKEPTTDRKASFLGDKLFPSILSTRYLASGVHSIPGLAKEGSIHTNKNPIYAPIM
jgi:hypothetical protein